MSTITFGDWDLNQVDGGEEGLNYYNNSAEGMWAVELEDLRYDEKKMKLGTVYYEIWDDNEPRIAYIDSGNTSIQIPKTQFENFKKEIKKVDDTIYEQTVEEQ